MAILRIGERQLLARVYEIAVSRTPKPNNDKWFRDCRSITPPTNIFLGTAPPAAFSVRVSAC
jgi:hypothetical protein